MQRWLVIFDGQQIVAAALQHNFASGLGLSMQGIQRNETPLQIQVGKEVLGHGNLVGLGIDHRAGQIILAGHADGRQHTGTAAVFGFLAVQGDQLPLGRWTP